jgi:hypothetical protein
VLTQEQARTWAGIDPTMRFTCPAGRCFSSLGSITDCEHARGRVTVSRAYGGGGTGIWLRDGGGAPRPRGDGDVLIIDDGEPDAAAIAGARAWRRWNNQRYLDVANGRA